MKAQIKLCRMFGVEIGLHYSWFIIALLITLSLAGQMEMVGIADVVGDYRLRRAQSRGFASLWHLHDDY